MDRYRPPEFTTGGDDISENRRLAREAEVDRMVAAGNVGGKTRETMGYSPGGRAENLLARARNEARPLANQRLRDMPDRPRGLPTGYEDDLDAGPKGAGPKEEGLPFRAQNPRGKPEAYASGGVVSSRGDRLAKSGRTKGRIC